MIEFYNRQANYGIRADPVECIAAMRERGLEPLKEAQIKSWWSTYHQKRKREMESMAADIQNLQRAPPAGNANLSAPPSASRQTYPSGSANSATVPSSYPKLMVIGSKNSLVSFEDFRFEPDDNVAIKSCNKLQIS